MANIKTYVLDTNILLQAGPSALYGFEDNDVYLTGTTMQELDNKKTASGEVGYNAREVIRTLDELREQGDLRKGVSLGNGGHLIVEPNGVSDKYLINGFSIEKPDNRIISTCLYLANIKQLDPILVTQDISLRINASISGVKVESYQNEEIKEDYHYTGRTTIEAEADDIAKIFGKGTLSAKKKIERYEKLLENEYVTLKNGSTSALTVYKDGKLNRVREKSVFGIQPKNSAQYFILDALTDKDINLCIITGPAGTAKTFLSLAAGIDQVHDNLFDKVLITRNNVSIDDGFGYLPGDLDEKAAPLLAPFYDNIETLLRNHEPKEDAAQIQMQVEDYMETIIQFAPMAYMRGRSLSNAFLIVDEAQNATRNQIKDVITRAGAGTKVVLLGDPHQIDAHNLDRKNNGLVFAAEKMAGSKQTAIIELSEKECVRSALASEAIQRLV